MKLGNPERKEEADQWITLLTRVKKRDFEPTELINIFGNVN
jgi:hypothetical protein